MNCLNLGCGRRFHSAWTNVDIVSTGQEVIAHDLTQGIPFPDCSFDVVYHSHILEHFLKSEAVSFLKECYRVLNPEGILRIAVPDLEQIIRTYLIALEKASDGSQEWGVNYEWILLEMYDQTVRNHSGGQMALYLSQEHIVNKEFVLKRWGIEAKKIIESTNRQHKQVQNTLGQENQLKHLFKKIYRFFRYPNYRRETLIKQLLGQEYSALQVGRFRQSGEIHQWMYDRYSLKLLLQKCGFKDILQRTATESCIPDWAHFNLDTEPDGTIHKPDSLYMESIKP